MAKIDDFKNIPTDDKQYPYKFIENSNAIVLEIKDEKIIVGITEKTSSDVISTLSNFHNEPVEFINISQVELSSWLGKQLGEDKNYSGISSSFDEKNSLDKIANDAPTINLVNSICIDAIRAEASDIHIESGTQNAKVRYRIDGLLQTVRTIENERFAAISSRIKIMSNLNILEKRQPQDGRITVTINNENIDLRVSIVPITNGESIVLRILGKNNGPQTLDKLGFSTKQLNDIKNMLHIPHGLILVTGPTGSGKTTTLNAMLKEMIDDTTKIISIEDPVEYVVEGVNQIQINEQINLGFDSILRRVLRQDPNIIMVGEIRDKATAELSVRAALTGHLVLSTLHTNDSISVIPRLINMGIEPYLISSVLRGAIAQRLVRKVTSDGKSYKGRTVISEEFLMDSSLEKIINNGADQNEITAYLKSKGMIFLTQDALDKVKKNITTKEEIRREVFI